MANQREWSRGIRPGRGMIGSLRIMASSSRQPRLYARRAAVVATKTTVRSLLYYVSCEESTAWSRGEAHLLRGARDAEDQCRSQGSAPGADPPGGAPLFCPARLLRHHD